MKESIERYEQTRKKVHDTHICINKEITRYMKRVESAELIYRDGVITEETFLGIKAKYDEITLPLLECERVVVKYNEYVNYRMGQDYPEYSNPLDSFFEPERLTEEEYEILKKAFIFESEMLMQEVSDGDRK